MALKILRKGKQKYQIGANGCFDNLNPTLAKKNAAYIRKKGGLCRVIKKSNGLYQIWVNSPFSLAEIKRENQKAGSFFFSRDTMNFFRGSKYSVRYDITTGITYVDIKHPKVDPLRDFISTYRYSAKTGKLESCEITRTKSKI